MAGKQDPLCKESRNLVIALLVLSILNWPWCIWISVYGFYDATWLYLGNGYSYQNRTRTLGSLGLVDGLVCILFGLFSLVKVTMFSLDLDRQLDQPVRQKWIKAYLIIEPVFFFLVLPFTVAYSVYYEKVHEYTFTFLWILFAIDLGMQLVTYPVALKLRSVEKGQLDVRRRDTNDADWIRLNEAKSETNSVHASSVQRDPERSAS